MFLKEPIKFLWYITRKCNLRCKFCYLADYSGENITQEQIYGVLNLIVNKKVVSVSLLGGEPTQSLYFEEIITFLNLNKINFNFSTNGIRLATDKKLLRILADFRYLSGVQVSLDSPDEKVNDSLRGRGSYVKAISAIKQLREAEIPVTVAMVLNKYNMENIQVMIKLSECLNVNALRFMPFMSVGMGKALYNDLFIDEIQRNELLCNAVSEKVKISTYLKKPCTQNKNTFGCGAGTTTAVLDTDMKLSACALSVDSDKSSNGLYSYTIDEFDQIWQYDNVFTKWRSGIYANLVKQSKCPIFEFCSRLI